MVTENKLSTIVIIVDKTLDHGGFWHSSRGPIVIHSHNATLP